MDLSKNWNWQPEKRNWFGKYFQVLLPLTSRGIFKHTWIGKIRKCSMFMSMFKDTEWKNKERQYRKSFAHCQRSGSIRDPFQARTHVLPWGPASENTWWTGNSNEPHGIWDVVAIQLGWHIKVSYFLPDMSSNRATIDWTVEERRKQLPFLMYIRHPRRFSSRPYWQSIYCAFYTRICQWYEVENQELTPRTAEYEEQIDLKPEELTFIAEKQQTLPQATYR